ncbi:unnamed protein product [Closterium sp. NIES-64]|nr:unnamed protein product [Closterium sp. NIES-64]
MLSSPLQLCSPAGSSPSHRAFLSGPSPPLHALAFVPARLVSLSTSPCSSLAAAASLATVPMLLPFLAADELRASACLRRLLFPAAAGREASGIRRSPSSPIALAGQTSLPPRRAPLAAGRASLMSWAPPRVLLPAASGGWLHVACPPILPCASAACPAIVRRLRPSPLVPGASRASLPPVGPQRRGLYLREMPAFAASAPEIARARVTAHLVLVPPPGD